MPVVVFCHASLYFVSCFCFFFSSRRRHTRWPRDWSSDVCSSDLVDVAEPFTPEALKALEKEMGRIVKEGQRFVRREISDDQARAEEAGEPYKLELIGLKSNADDAAEGASVEVGEGGLTMYDNVNRRGEVVWTDLCRGPHLPTTRLIGKGFALTRSAAAYWRGS